MFLSLDGPKIAIERPRLQKGRTSKEAFEMFDSFSEGSVFYGRAVAVIAAAMVLAVVLHVI